MPLIFEMPQIINLWLGQVPPYVILFARLVLIDVLIGSLSYPLMTAAQATGKIKLYQAVVGGILLLNLPLSYIALKLGAIPESVLIIAIILTIIAFFVRLVILKELIGLSILNFVKNVFMPTLSITILSFLVLLIFHNTLPANLLRLFITVIISTITIIVLIFLLGINNEERMFILKYLHKK